MKSPKKTFRLTKFQKNILCGLIVLIGLVALGLAAAYKYAPQLIPDYNKELDATVIAESHFLVAGDVYIGRRLHDKAQHDTLGYAYPFSRLDELGRENYDAWIANLECPSVAGVKQDPADLVTLRNFNCDTDYLTEAAKWFDVFSLANNHTSNQERELGLEETRRTLDSLSIQHFGDFNPHNYDQLCKIVALPARAWLNGQQAEIKLPVALCGYHGVYYTIDDKAIAEIAEYAKYVPVIAFPHAGVEYTKEPTPEVREMYRKMIEAGAAAVFGGHPHWVQETEIYKGKLIAYSLGNFIFDQQFNDEVSRGVGFDVVMKVDHSDLTEAQLLNYQELLGSCEGNCLAAFATAGLPRYRAEFAFHPIAVDTSGLITHLAGRKLHDQVLARLKWPEVKQNHQIDADGRVILWGY
jgi:poly-gamma-glutamate synthesis protein (capsule biosynthesis protein)